MSYFVTGATGFIGRHLVERLLEREGDIHVLVREGSREKLDALRAGWGPGADRVKPIVGDLSEPLLGVSEEDRKALAGVEHFFHLAAIYDMTADEERNRRLNVNGTQHAVDLANELGAGHFHHASSIAVAGEYEGHFTEDSFDEGQKLTHPYHRTKFEAEKLVRQRTGGAVARVPALDRRRQLQDRRDGQDRRPLLLLQGDPEGSPRAAGVVPAGRHRGRQDEHRPRRLRRRGDGPHRPPARPRRPGLPPRRPEDEAGRRRHQHLRRGRPRAEDGHPDRQEDDRHAAEGRPVLRDEAAGAQGHPAHAARRPRHPRLGHRVRRPQADLRRARHQARARGLRHRAARRSRATPTSCGTTGSATSTPTCSGTARSSTRSTAGR